MRVASRVHEARINTKYLGRFVMKRLTSALMGLTLMLTFAVSAFAGDCCDGGSCCTKGACCKVQKSKK